MCDKDTHSAGHNGDLAQEKIYDPSITRAFWGIGIDAMKKQIFLYSYEQHGKEIGVDVCFIP
jgi:hypothetical protein